MSDSDSEACLERLIACFGTIVVEGVENGEGSSPEALAKYWERVEKWCGEVSPETWSRLEKVLADSLEIIKKKAHPAD